MNFITNVRLSSALLIAALIGVHHLTAAASELPEVQRLIERRDFKQALGKVNQHLAVRPDSIDGRFFKGVILAESNEAQQAIVIFTQLTKDAPQMLEAYNNLGVLYARQQEYDKSRATLEAALKVDPAFAAVASNLRNTYGRLAKQAYEKALGQEPGGGQAGKGLVLLSQLRAPSAASEKALEVVANKLTAVAVAPVAPVAPVAQQATAVAVQQAAPPEAAKAQPKPKPEVSDSKSGAAALVRHADVRQAVSSWSEAWMRKDMKAYLASYAPDFSLPRGQSRSEWERERTKRILGKKDRIQLVIEKLDVVVQDSVATAKFQQHYRAGSFTNSTVKVLTLVRQDGKWRIKSEK